jgi:hypothetical protein
VYIFRVTSKGHVETWKDGSEHISLFHTFYSAFYNMLADAYVQWYIESNAIN